MSKDYRSRMERRQSADGSKPANKTKTKKPRGGRNWKKTLLLLIVALGLLGVLTIGVIAATSPKLDPKKLETPVSSKILDMNDEQVSLVSGQEKRIRVKINEIPEPVQNAFIATEDVRFRKHSGVDIKRIFGAAFANVTEGFGAEGASTISQQVIKNSVLTSDKTLTRKIREAYLSVQLEQKYSKDQILEMYLNKIFFGNRSFGIATAAKTYFNKDVSKLELHEAALLAGLPKAPSYYNPLENPKEAEHRRNVVLNLMAQHKFITKEEAEKAKKISVKDSINQGEVKTGSSPYDAYIKQVMDDMKDIEGLEDVDIFSSGLKIHTNLDTTAQQVTEDVLKAKLENENKFLQSGVAIVDTKTGVIRAIGSGRGGQYSNYYSSKIKRQPGSTIKPILDYGPAIENKKWSTAHLLKDEPVKIGDVTINNYNDKNVGDMTMRQALVESKNTTAVRTFQDIGPEEATDFANKLGFDLDPDTTYPSYAIGGFKDGISPLTLAGSYAAFGNGGVYSKPTTIRKIEFPDGRIIEVDSEPKAAMKDYTAYMITDMLKDVMDRGTGTQANVSGLHLAGKTGTTNFTKEDRDKLGLPDNATQDAWMAGYTTSYTASVWTGYSEKQDEEKNPLYLNDTKDDYSKQIFRDIMSQLKHKNTDFKKPKSVTEVAMEKGTGKRASEYTPDSEKIIELFVKGSDIPDVSDKFEKPSSIEGLKAKYNEEKNEIEVNWKFEKKEGVTFKILASYNDGPMQERATINDTQFVVPSPAPGKYTFQVIAVDNENNTESEPAETSITIEAPEGPPEEEPGTPPDEEEPETPPGEGEPGTPPPGQEPGTPPGQGEPGTPPPGGGGDGDGDQDEDGGGIPFPPVTQ
ncbi:PBP1A family penicillin-binding protein [Fictibacillus nanhaiensis]|uniref:transglycosylase domain-containing protein n=1 Tax=Fictibacillus nanhaiensis TaxID=742169 RepID=UPI001C982832|nr:PBP1A family penicillin-binding protein [Fictibacillus nanhaiensis]MBY6035732.1 PBP1A family penicillin-binding protein [Fictibacillus nanhaiensis]